MAFDKEELELLHDSIINYRFRMSFQATSPFFKENERRFALDAISKLDRLSSKICKEKYESKNS